MFGYKMNFIIFNIITNTPQKNTAYIRHNIVTARYWIKHSLFALFHCGVELLQIIHGCVFTIVHNVLIWVCKCHTLCAHKSCYINCAVSRLLLLWKQIHNWKFHFVWSGVYVLSKSSHRTSRVRQLDDADHVVRCRRRAHLEKLERHLLQRIIVAHIEQWSLQQGTRIEITKYVQDGWSMSKYFVGLL